MLDISKLRKYFDIPFLDIIDGIQQKSDPIFPCDAWWEKNNQWYFFRNAKGSIVCHNYNVWQHIKNTYQLHQSQVRDFIQYMMERYLKNVH